MRGPGHRDRQVDHPDVEPGLLRLLRGPPDRGDLRVGEDDLRDGRVVGRRDVFAPGRGVHRIARGAGPDRRADDPRVVLALVGQRGPARDVARRVEPLARRRPAPARCRRRSAARRASARPTRAPGRRRSAGGRWRPAARRPRSSRAPDVQRDRVAVRGRPSRARCPAARPRPRDAAPRRPSPTANGLQPRAAAAARGPAAPPPTRAAATPGPARSRRPRRPARPAGAAPHARRWPRGWSRRGRSPCRGSAGGPDGCRWRPRPRAGRVNTVVADPDHAFPVEPGPAPDHRDPRALGPVDLARVVPAVGDRVAALQDRLDVELGRRRRGAGGPRRPRPPCAAAPCWACTPSTSTRRRPARTPPSRWTARTGGRSRRRSRRPRRRR